MPELEARPSLRGLLRAAILFSVCCGLTLILYRKSLNAHLIWDDVGILLYFNPGVNLSWLDCLMPLGNGFLRPATILLFKLLYTWVGTAPLAYHLAAISIHCAVAVAGGLLAGRLMPDHRWMSAAVALALTVHAAAFSCVYMLSNSCDTVMTLGLLLGLRAWDAWLHRRSRSALAGVWLGGALALAGKETAVVYPALLLLWACGKGAFDRRMLAHIAAGGVIFSAYLTLIIYLQRSVPISYANSGTVDLKLTPLISRWTAYLVSTIAPFLHVMDWPFPRHPLPSGILRLCQIGAGLVLVFGAWSVASQNRWRMQGALLLCSAAVLAPTMVLNLNVTGRFVYGALPFVVIAVALTGFSLRRKVMHWLIGGLAVILIAMHLITLSKSPTVKTYRATSRQWQNFVSELGRISPAWPPLSYVTVYTGPDHGSTFISKPYGGTIFRVFFPYLLADYYANEVPNEKALLYQFNGKSLIPLKVPIR